MRFEVNVDDGSNFDALHRARVDYNAKNPGAIAPDMPSFVQCLMDQAVAGALDALPTPSTLSAALAKIAQLEAEKAVLEKDASLSVAPAKPV